MKVEVEKLNEDKEDLRYNDIASRDNEIENLKEEIASLSKGNEGNMEENQENNMENGDNQENEEKDQDNDQHNVSSSDQHNISSSELSRVDTAQVDLVTSLQEERASLQDERDRVQKKLKEMLKIGDNANIQVDAAANNPDSSVFSEGGDEEGNEKEEGALEGVPKEDQNDSIPVDETSLDKEKTPLIQNQNATAAQQLPITYSADDLLSKLEDKLNEYDEEIAEKDLDLKKKESEIDQMKEDLKELNDNQAATHKLVDEVDRRSKEFADEVGLEREELEVEKFQLEDEKAQLELEKSQVAAEKEEADRIKQEAEKLQADNLAKQAELEEMGKKLKADAVTGCCFGP